MPFYRFSCRPVLETGDPGPRASSAVLPSQGSPAEELLPCWDGSLAAARPVSAPLGRASSRGV